MEQKAFLFDLNGTIIDDMSYHISAWYGILNGLGANISMEQMRNECYGKNTELLERIFPGRFSKEEKNELSNAKESAYREKFRPCLRGLPGLNEFLSRAYSNKIKMAIGSAAIMSNIDFVLDGLDIRKYFSAIVSADDVSFSKPHPETYLKCAELLNINTGACIVFEDAPSGVKAAANAGMRAVVITTMHTEQEFETSSNIIFFAKDFEGIDMKILQ